MTMNSPVLLTMIVNGERVTREIEPRRTLSDFLREDLGLTGTHVGCEHGVCGACTVLVDGASTRACISYAVQFEGAEITTIESITGDDGGLHPVLEAFRECHGLQCGFCTPGMVMTILEFLGEVSSPTETETRSMLSGNLCRCTGYETIVDAVMLADTTWQREVHGSNTTKE